jgi:hypothetical protein
MATLEMVSAVLILLISGVVLLTAALPVLLIVF